jgi:hypothetical protein
MRSPSIWLLVIACLTLAPSLRAQIDAPPDEATRLIAEGVELRKQGKEREALERFEKAHALEPSPRALAQMGLATKSLRMFVQAEDYLDRALAADSDVWVRDNRPALSLALEVVKKNLAWLEVKSNVPAELSVDGNRVAELPLKSPVRVRAGAIRIDVRAPGYETWSTTETLAGGGSGTVTATLKPLPKVVSKAARSPAAIDPRPVDAPSSDTARTTWMWTALGVGAAGVVVGTVFGLRALSLKEERDKECPTATCTTDKGVELDQDARTASTWSTVGFVVGAAGLGTATVLFLAQPKRPRQTTRSSFSLSLSLAGASATASF